MMNVYLDEKQVKGLINMDVDVTILTERGHSLSPLEVLAWPLHKWSGHPPRLIEYCPVCPLEGPRWLLGFLLSHRTQGTS